MSSVTGILVCAECGYGLIEWYYDCHEGDHTLMEVAPALKQVYRFKEKGTHYTQNEATGKHEERKWEVQASIMICPRCGTAAICRWEIPEDLYTPFQKPLFLEKPSWEMTNEEIKEYRARIKREAVKE